MRVSNRGGRYDLVTKDDRAECILFELADKRSPSRFDCDPEPDGYAFLDVHSYSLRML